MLKSDSVNYRIVLEMTGALAIANSQFIGSLGDVNELSVDSLQGSINVTYRASCDMARNSDKSTGDAQRDCHKSSQLELLPKPTLKYGSVYAKSSHRSLTVESIDETCRTSRRRGITSPTQLSCFHRRKCGKLRMTPLSIDS